MNFTLLYTRDDDLRTDPLQCFLRAVKERQTSPQFSIEANSIISKHKTFTQIKITDADLNLVLQSDRGEPVRRLPAIVHIEQDTNKLAIVTGVLHTDSLLADDVDILLQ